MRRAGFRLALVFTIVFFAAAPVRAQWNTPTIDGYIAPGEYGSNNSLSNAGNTGQTWYMTWDATNLYVGIVNANLGEAAVIYIAGNPQNPPTCCSNADGNLTGFNNYDGTDFASLPFRAKFVTYVKTDYREYRNSDGGGGWTSPVSYYGSYADNGNNQNTREVAIPWNAITSGGAVRGRRPYPFLTPRGIEDHEISLCVVSVGIERSGLDLRASRKFSGPVVDFWKIGTVHSEPADSGRVPVGGPHPKRIPALS